ncbi:MAG: hypothetical protein WDM81_06910 [Rhizomicrobium sp.]
MGDFKTLEIDGKRAIRVYHAKIREDDGHCRTSNGPAAFLLQMRHGAVVVRRCLARPGASLRLGDRHPRCPSRRRRCI